VLTIGAVYTVTNLVSDLLYIVLNPRLRVGGAE
jgi:peptide/nickel transport system permease protein